MTLLRRRRSATDGAGAGRTGGVGAEFGEPGDLPMVRQLVKLVFEDRDPAAWPGHRRHTVRE